MRSQKSKPRPKLNPIPNLDPKLNPNATVGGVLMVWTQALEFLQGLCQAYPQVHDDLRKHGMCDQDPQTLNPNA